MRKVILFIAKDIALLTNWVMNIRLYWAVKNTIRKQDMYQLTALASNRLLMYRTKTLWHIK